MRSQVVRKRASVSKYIHVAFPHNVLFQMDCLAFAAKRYTAKSGEKRDKYIVFSNMEDRGKGIKMIFLLEYFWFTPKHKVDHMENFLCLKKSSSLIQVYKGSFCFLWQ